MLPNKSSGRAAILALCSIAMLSGGCGSTNPEISGPTNSAVRGSQPLDEWRFEDGTEENGRHLLILVPTCHGEPEADVEQTESSVVITVIATKHVPGDGCQDVVSITLDEPLGDRSVIDGTTGETF